MDTPNPLEELVREEESSRRLPTLQPFILPRVLAAERIIQQELSDAGADTLKLTLDQLLPVERRASLLVQLAEMVDEEPNVALKAITTINEITGKVEGAAGVTFVLPDGSQMKLNPDHVGNDD